MGTCKQARLGRKVWGKRRRRAPAAHRRLIVEMLESRMLLTATVNLPGDLRSIPVVHPLGDSGSDTTGSSSPSPYALTPNMIRGAYELGSYTSTVLSNGLTFGPNQTPGDGRGQTIAIIDSYDDPQAATDLTTFSYAYGLPLFNEPGDPTFTQLSEYGQPVNRTSQQNENYVPSNSSKHATSVEESIDIEWAHAMAPMANIILFEAKSNSNTNVYTAIQTAANTPGVDVVSMSFGADEFSGETSFDPDFTTPAGHLAGESAISTALAESGTTVAFTGTNNFTAGESVTIADASPTGFNGTYLIASATANNFTYTDSTSGLGTATAQAVAAINLGGAASTSTSLAESGKTVTFTGTNNFTAGETVTIANASPAGYNGTYVVASATANNFTYTDSTSGLATATAQAVAAIDPGDAASTSTSLVESGTTVTFTGTNNFTAGESVTIADASPAGFDGAYVIASATANSFTYIDSTSGLRTATAQAVAAS